tara:strand:- start:649 stop:831 length:183 start_codon:yes stop_codon:yes gene_type:complete
MWNPLAAGITKKGSYHFTDYHSQTSFVGCGGDSTVGSQHSRCGFADFQPSVPVMGKFCRL